MKGRVCVVGGGVIGSLYAAHLAAVAEVWVLTRRAEHARALEDEGLRVSGKHDFTASLRATADPTELPELDLAILATKATQLDAAAAGLAGRAPGATVMTIQNGLGAEEIVRRHGDWQIVSAVTFMSGDRHGDTHVEYELDTATWLGPYELEIFSDDGTFGSPYADSYWREEPADLVRRGREAFLRQWERAAVETTA